MALAANILMMRDKAGTRARIASLSERLVQIEKSKSELIRQLADLDAEFVAKKCERDALQYSSAPISSLPNEVLAQIFKIGSDSCRRRLDDAPFEFLVSQVTRHWRAVALNTSTLWTRVYRHEWQCNLDPIALYLQRSRQAHIDLVVKIGHEVRDWGFPDETEDDDISPFCRLMEPHFSRCCSLVIASLNSSEDFKMLAWLAPQCSLILRSLSLYLKYSDFRRPLCILEGGAQSLTHVEVEGVALVHCCPPLTNVTTLHVDLDNWLVEPIDYQRVAEILSAMPSLNHLVLKKVPDVWPTGAPMVLPTLQIIEFTLPNLAVASEILAVFNAPSLREMTMVLLPHFTHHGEVVLHCPSEFPCLHAFYLKAYVSISSSIIRALSRIFPHLVKMTFAYRGVNCDGAAGHMSRMLALTQEDRGPHHNVSVWPRLLTLGIHVPGNRPFPMNELRSFLVERATKGLPIRTLLLPPAYISKGRELSSCTVSPVIIEELMGYAPVSDDLFKYFTYC